MELGSLTFGQRSNFSRFGSMSIAELQLMLQKSLFEGILSKKVTGKSEAQ
jgi:hypothetical protein